MPLSAEYSKAVAQALAKTARLMPDVGAAIDELGGWPRR